MAQVKNANQKLYVMQPSMSSPFFVTRSEKYDEENAKKQWYKFPEGDRKKIQAIRQEINVITDAGCARFYGLKIANETSKEQITTAIQKADAKMKEIDVTLHAGVMFLPLQSEAFKSGSLLDNMTAQIFEQIHGKVLTRIEDTIKKNGDSGILSAKTKTSLLKMLDKCRAVNVIGDETVNQRIDNMKNQINNDQIMSMRDEILDLLDEGKDRFSSIDMFNLKTGSSNDSETRVAEPLTPKEQAEIDADDRKYADRPEPEEDENKKKSASRFDVM